MGQVLQFTGEADRLPEAAQIFAAGRIGADMGEFCVFIGYLAMEVAAVSRLRNSALVVMVVFPLMPKSRG
jgi:hypothetical protein